MGRWDTDVEFDYDSEDQVQCYEKQMQFQNSDTHDEILDSRYGNLREHHDRQGSHRYYDDRRNRAVQHQLETRDRREDSREEIDDQVL